ncbi:unnamed protein product, partial [Vitis vinifera]
MTDPTLYQISQFFSQWYHHHLQYLLCYSSQFLCFFFWRPASSLRAKSPFPFPTRSMIWRSSAAPLPSTPPTQPPICPPPLRISAPPTLSSRSHSSSSPTPTSTSPRCGNNSSEVMKISTTSTSTPIQPFSTVYSSFIEILSNSSSLWKRYTARGRYAMLPEVPFSKFRVGSQFFVLTRRHALVVVKDRQLWKKFKLPCLRSDSCYPEEHYFPTLLSMTDPNGCTHYTLTRVNWTGSTHGHPHTYRSAEISAELIYRLRQSNSNYSYLFARKFTPDCLQPLMNIAGTVIFRD